MRGLTQIYTGNGKGKTTAALGLAIRSVGAGLKVYIGQFIKSGNYNEIKSFKKFKKRITVEQYGKGCFVNRFPKKKDIELAKQGIDRAKEILLKKQYDVVILDELLTATHLKLLNPIDTVQIIKIKPRNTELILTGRYAHPKVLKLADLVTEMKEVKHYFKKGIKARKGIEY